MTSLEPCLPKSWFLGHSGFLQAFEQLFPTTITLSQGSVGKGALISQVEQNLSRLQQVHTLSCSLPLTLQRTRDLMREDTN